MDKKLVFDLYADYERLNWTSTWHHSRQMTKAFIAYTTPALTVGVEGYINVMKNDDLAQLIAPPNPQHTADTLTSNAIGISAYVHGDIVKNKLRFFARYDNTKNNSKANVSIYKSYTSRPATMTIIIRSSSLRRAWILRLQKGYTSCRISGITDIRASSLRPLPEAS